MSNAAIASQQARRLPVWMIGACVQHDQSLRQAWKDNAQQRPLPAQRRSVAARLALRQPAKHDADHGPADEGGSDAAMATATERPGSAVRPGSLTPPATNASRSPSLVRAAGFEPALWTPEADFKSAASANSATPARRRPGPVATPIRAAAALAPTPRPSRRVRNQSSAEPLCGPTRSEASRPRASPSHGAQHHGPASSHAAAAAVRALHTPNPASPPPKPRSARRRGHASPAHRCPAYGHSHHT